jgi:hypothetical protein
MQDHNEHQESPVRRRVRKHMRKLLASGAGAALTLGMCGCPDPPPPPPVTVDCENPDLSGDALAVEAVWDQEVNGFVVNAYVYFGYETNLSLAGEPTLVGGELGDFDTEGNSGFTLEFIPSPGSTQVQASVPLHCDHGIIMATIAFDVSGTPNQGNSLPVVVEAAPVAP